MKTKGQVLRKGDSISLKALLLLFLLFVVGCGKDIDPVSVKPTINPTFSIVNNGTKSADVQVRLTWTTEYTVKARLENNSIPVPAGDTLVSMKKGETKVFNFFVENAAGLKVSKQLVVSISTDPPSDLPTLYVSWTMPDGTVVDSIPKLGSPIKMTIVTKNGDSVWINDVFKPFYGVETLTFLTDSIKVDKNFTVRLKGKGGEVVKSFLVPVTRLTWVETLLWFHSYKYTYRKISRDNGITWEFRQLSYCEVDDVRTYYPQKIVGDFGQELCGISPRIWEFKIYLVSLLGFNNGDKIININSSSMILRYQSKEDGVDVLFEEGYQKL